MLIRFVGQAADRLLREVHDLGPATECRPPVHAGPDVPVAGVRDVHQVLAVLREHPLGVAELGERRCRTGRSRALALDQLPELGLVDRRAERLCPGRDDAVGLDLQNRKLEQQLREVRQHLRLQRQHVRRRVDDTLDLIERGAQIILVALGEVLTTPGHEPAPGDRLAAEAAAERVPPSFNVLAAPVVLARRRPLVCEVQRFLGPVKLVVQGHERVQPLLAARARRAVGQDLAGLLDGPAQLRCTEFSEIPVVVEPGQRHQRAARPGAASVCQGEHARRDREDGIAKAPQVDVVGRVAGDGDEPGVAEDLDVEQPIEALAVLGVAVLFRAVCVVLAGADPIRGEERAQTGAGRGNLGVSALDQGDDSIVRDPPPLDAVVEVERDHTAPGDRSKADTRVTPGLHRCDGLVVGGEPGDVLWRALFGLARLAGDVERDFAGFARVLFLDQAPDEPLLFRAKQTWDIRAGHLPSSAQSSMREVST